MHKRDTNRVQNGVHHYQKMVMVDIFFLLPITKKYVNWFVALFPTNSTLFLNVCEKLLQIVGFFSFAFMAFYNLTTSVGKTRAVTLQL